VANPQFISGHPTSAIQISAYEMLIFGGDNTTTFTFDTREVNGRQAKVNTMKNSGLQIKGRFC